MVTVGFWLFFAIMNLVAWERTGDLFPLFACGVLCGAALLLWIHTIVLRRTHDRIQFLNDENLASWSQLKSAENRIRALEQQLRRGVWPMTKVKAAIDEERRQASALKAVPTKPPHGDGVA